MGSRMRSDMYDRDSRRYERDDAYNYREDDIQDRIPFTTAVNPDIFSGPIPDLDPSVSSNRGNYSSSYQGDYVESAEERRYRRDSYYDEDERRSRRPERERYDRSRDRSRERDRGHDRFRDRSYEERDEDRRDRDRGIGRDQRDWKEEIPNNTLMIRGLDISLGETDIRDEVRRFGLEPKDIRLIREKGSGASRGFAFVEFQLLSEAVRWKELSKGSVVFRGNNRASLHYSIPKEMVNNDRFLANKTDWDCPKCGMSNFKRRDFCFKCNCAREESYDWQHGECHSEISYTPSKTLLFGNLDVLTTEGRVLAMLGQLTSLPIKSLRVAKDSLTNTSRGYAFVELNSTSEAIQLHDLLVAMGGNFFVDGRQVTVSYAKKSLISRNSSNSVNAASVALAAAQWTNQQDDAYSQYYNQVASSAVPVTTVAASSVVTTTASTVTKATASATTSNQTQLSSLGTVIINGATYCKYPLPDISTYQYDDSSGFYYDASTGLYYDANSQYYYNSETQQYLYWDGDHQTYLPVPSTTDATSGKGVEQPPVPAAEPEDSEKSKKKEEKHDKVKIAKKIAKDMEKWAKTLNQKKENAKLGIVSSPAAVPSQVAASSNNGRYSATADAGFAILEKRTTLAERNALMAELDTKINMSAAPKATLVSYGDDTDSEPEGEGGQPQQAGVKGAVDESRFIDLSKMACLLCKRQFPNKDALNRHQQLSDLHKKNLAKVTGS